MTTRTIPQLQEAYKVVGDLIEEFISESRIVDRLYQDPDSTGEERIAAIDAMVRTQTQLSMLAVNGYLCKEFPS